MSAPNISNHATVVADVISAGAIIGAFTKALPPVAALCAIIWYAVQIWESHTVQKWWRLHHMHRQTHSRIHRRHRLARHAHSLLDTLKGLSV